MQSNSLIKSTLMFNVLLCRYRNQRTYRVQPLSMSVCPCAFGPPLPESEGIKTTGPTGSPPLTSDHSIPFLLFHGKSYTLTRNFQIAASVRSCNFGAVAEFGENRRRKSDQNDASYSRQETVVFFFSTASRSDSAVNTTGFSFLTCSRQ